MKILNIYGQAMEHLDARIIGNREGLTELRDAINSALMSGAESPPEMQKAKTLNRDSDQLYASDGEGYSVLVVCKNDEWGIKGGEDSYWNKKESYPEYTRFVGGD